MSDTPIHSPSVPPPAWEERLKGFVGDLARPFNQYVIGGSTAVAIVIGATKITTAEGGAIYIGAVGLITTAIYGIKAVENIKSGNQARDVEIAKTNTPPPSALTSRGRGG